MKRNSNPLRMIALTAIILALLCSQTFAGRGIGTDELNITLRKGYKLIEGDMAVPIDFEQQQALGCYLPQLWTSGVVPYEFNANVNSTNRNRAVAAMAEWEAISGVDFVPRTTQSDYVHIKSDPGNWSYVGCIGGKQEIGIYNWSWKFIIAHELGHALSLWHEQSREDRNSYVTINTANIIPGKEQNFEIHAPGSTWPGLVFGPYDFESVMHYGDYAFSNNGLPTISVLAPFTYWQTRIGQRTKLSHIDMVTMSNLYPDPSGLSGSAWDPNMDGIVLTVADLVYHIRVCLGEAIAYPNPLGYEYDGWANPYFPGEPTFGDAIHFSLYFTVGFNSLLTTTRPVDNTSPSSIEIIYPPTDVFVGSGTQSYTIKIRNNGPDTEYLWLATIPVKLPKAQTGQGVLSYSLTNFRSYPGVAINWRDITTSPTDFQKFGIMVNFAGGGGAGATPYSLASGQTMDICDVQANWSLSWGSVSFDADTCLVAPAWIPTASTSKTIAGIPKSGTLIPDMTQGYCEHSNEGSFVDGDADGNGIVEISDAVFLLSYIFDNGPAPNPIESGDADCNGIVEVSDVVYLINYIFTGGPPPGCGGPVKDNWNEYTDNMQALASGSGELLALIDDAQAKVEIKLDCDVPLAGLQLEFSVDQEQAKLLRVTSGGTANDLELFSGVTEGLFKIGLVDLTGFESIPSGEAVILAITASDGSLPEIELVHVVAADRQAGNVQMAFETLYKSETLPISYSLGQNYPNPFNPSTLISYSLPGPAEVRLEVYNLLGQRINTLVESHQPAGNHSVEWNGQNQHGNTVASGVYFYKLSTDDFTQTRKMVLLK